MSDRIMDLRLLALALWNAHGNVGVALGLPDETARLLIRGNFLTLHQILSSKRQDIRRVFHLRPDYHLQLLSDALAQHNLSLETPAAELPDILNALILPSEVTANM